MSTVSVPPGSVVIRPGSFVRIRSEPSPGAMVCGMKLQDYVPASEQSVSLWLDAASGSGAGGTATRAPATVGLAMAPRRGSGSGFAAIASSCAGLREKRSVRSAPSLGPRHHPTGGAGRPVLRPQQHRSGGNLGIRRIPPPPPVWAWLF